MRFDGNDENITAQDLPLTSGQRGLWFLHQMDPLSSRYNVPLTFKISEHISSDVITNVLNIFIQKHELLRSTFYQKNAKPLRKVFARAAVKVEKESVAFYSFKELLNLVQDKSSQPFDIEKGPLMRAVMFDGYKSRQFLLITFHHLVFDGASLKLLMDDINQIYQSLLDKTEILLQNNTSFEDFVKWQNHWLKSDDAMHNQKFWMQQFSENPSPLQLPLQNNKKNNHTITGQVKKITVPHHVYQQFSLLAKQHQCSDYLVWFMVYCAFLSRYTNNKDLVVGTPYMGRPESRFDSIIGHFANLVPIRCRVDDSHSFIKALSHFKNYVYEALFHADYPVEELIPQLDLPKQHADDQLFQTSFVWTQLFTLRSSSAVCISVR